MRLQSGLGECSKNNHEAAGAAGGGGGGRGGPGPQHQCPGQDVAPADSFQLVTRANT